jgi:class 3 adenylate cyclase/tetratricopeptide (TPR) repeat protein
MTVCPRCGSENREGARFCDACGSPLGAAPATGGFRRTVTVLFSDITGSTELGRGLDPELLRGILARYYDAMRSLLERHGGTVEKFIGDAVMAVFGIPRIHEDDAVRAVRAASEIPEALATLNEELERQHGVRIRARTGVATGEVMVGDPATAETLVTGMPANIAARLEQAAGRDEVLIGEETYRLVRDAVLAEAVEPLALKGVGDAVPAYRVQKVDPGAAGFARRLDAPMVGRERELALLRDAFDRAVSDGSCQLFTVLGIGGVGKSRLLAAFADRLPDGVTTLRGRCLPYGDGITFWPVIEAVQQAIGLDGTESAEGALAKIVDAVGDDEHAERIGRQLAQLLGLESGEAAGEETLWAIRRFLEGLARRQPVAFVIDDVQWAEPTMLDLIEYLADWVAEAPLLLACMARPELLDARPTWGGGKLNATSINLEPLSASETGTLVANLLAIDTVDATVRERVVAASEGHPLFAEEMLAMLVEDGLVVRSGTSWIPAGDLRDVTVPPTTSALLAARIDRLTAGERGTLERASVMGQVFYREAVAVLSDSDVSVELTSLIRKQFVRPERSDVPGIEALAFRHLMIRDAAYDGTPKTLRAELHERFADWLEAVASEQQELIGFHLEQAHSYLTEIGGDPERRRRLAERAATHLLAAGTRAWERFDVHATIGLLSRAIELMPRDEPAIVPASIELAAALTEAADFARADAVLEHAVGVAEAGSDPGLAARARVVRLYLSFWGPDSFSLDEARLRASDELAIAERTGDNLTAAWALAMLGGLSWSVTQAEETRPAWRRAVDLFREAGERHQAEDLLSWLCSVPAWGPTPCDEALRQIEGFVDEARGSLAVEAEVAAASHTPLWMLGRFDEAREVCRVSHERRLELGRVVQDAHMSQATGWVELMAGNVMEGERILRAGARDLTSMGSASAKLIANMHAFALYQLERYDEAGDVADAIARLPGYDDVSGTGLSLSVRAMVAARGGRFEEGHRLAREAVALLDEGDFINDQADARIALAEVLELAGRTDEAADAVRQAFELYRRKGNVVQGAAAEARLARVGGRPSSST